MEMALIGLGMMMQSNDLSPMGEKLLQIAQELATEPLEAQSPAPLSEFVQTYREWITVERGRAGTQQEQAEAWQLIVHGMLSASDVAGAIELLIRYAKVMWGGRGPSELRVDGKNAVLVFSEPFRPGPEGLMAGIWQLALTVCKLEFLTDAKLAGVVGCVKHECCLYEGALELLFGRKILFEQDEVALIFPRHHLRRPLVARAADLPRFFGQLLPLTLGARRESPSISSLVIGLLRDDKLGPVYRDSSLVDIACRLGMSTATVRRRLVDEGISFRELRDDVFNDLAKAWLEQTDISVEEIAERLGYSDSYAFRRFFRRINGFSPAAFRRSCMHERA